MITININLSSDAVQKATINTTQGLPSPQSSSGEKKESADAIPTPDTFDASITTEDVLIPAPEDFSSSTQEGIPRPTEINMRESATGDSSLPTPVTKAEESLSDAPQPSEDISRIVNSTENENLPTPNDATTLAKEVNEDIEKSEKKGRRSKTGTKKK